MITDISDSLIDVFGEYAVFRIGGDEFVAYSFADSKEEFTAQVEETRRRLREKGRSASMGAVYVTDASIPRSEVREKADALMYEDKERFYKGKNDRRR